MKGNIIGQDDVLKYVAVAIFKHVCNEKYGNIIMIGNSGTGKTSIMRAMQDMYKQYDFFKKLLSGNSFLALRLNHGAS